MRKPIIPALPRLKSRGFLVLKNFFKIFCKKVLTGVYLYSIIKLSDGDEQKTEVKKMFKKFIEKIIAAENREDAINNIFYGANGIDIAYQQEKITWKEHEMLLALIEKMA